jgi:uncharacterized protein with NAD-binding domain and iron-sulfur cluster
MYNTLFNPWVRQLENRNVNILLSHEVIKIHAIGQLTTLSNIDVRCINTKKIHNLTADIIINAMDIKNLAKLYPNPDDAINFKFAELDIKSSQIQTQVLYYLPYRLQNQNTEPTILILHNSPWFLMVRIEGDIWSLKNSDLLSCGIGIWDRPGTNQKCAINCTREEIAVECWKQISQTKHNLKLSSEMPKWDIWGSFKYNMETAKLDTFEPKFSNNIDTLALRPNICDSKFTNLYHATAYTRNYTNVYNMESAAESGVKAAAIIINKTKLIECVKTTPEYKCESSCYVDAAPSVDINETAPLFNEIYDIESVKLDKTYKKNIKWYFRLFRKIDSYFY